MNTEKQTYNKINMINDCANSIMYHLKNTQEIAGFIQHIILSNGGPDKYCKVKLPLMTTTLKTIKDCIEEAVIIAKEHNKRQKEKYGFGFEGFRIDFQLTTDRAKYVQLVDIDFRKEQSIAQTHKDKPP